MASVVRNPQAIRKPAGLRRRKEEPFDFAFQYLNPPSAHNLGVKQLSLIVCAAILAGCIGPQETTVEKEAPGAVNRIGQAPEAGDDAAPTVSGADNERSRLNIGMFVDDVIAIKGAPARKVHSHETEGQHLDIYEYEDVNVTFEKGKVARIEPIKK